MTLIKKCDVKMYFSSRQRKGLHLIQKDSKAAAARMLLADAAIEAGPAMFADDFSREHSSPGGTVSAVVIVTVLNDSQASEEPSTARP